MNEQTAAGIAKAAEGRGVIANPVLRGFNPDPYMLRAEGKYLIAVSSFEWLPGVRVYESADLNSWTHRADLLTDQVDLRGNPKNGSIWAPQLSWNEGRYYLVYTDVKSTRRPFKDSHNYLITATSLDGPWSAPVYLNSSGFDPSLFHDDDGRKWLLNEIWDYRLETSNKSAGIVMQEYDPIGQALIGEPVRLFDGTHLAKTEAPHIYKRDGWYYLITAEGGTGTGHAVTVLRSRQLAGPYEVDPAFPMMTASDTPDWPLQCAGHGSLVETPEGEWYMAHLCTRPVDGKYAILGRETAIQKVEWTEDGWLRLHGGGTLPLLETPAPAGDAHAPSSAHAPSLFEDRFDGPSLHNNWNTLRILKDESWCSLAARAGYLRIIAGESPQTLFRHHMVAIRQTEISFRAETTLDYAPSSYLQMAGLLLYLNDENYVYACVTHDERQGRVVRLMRCAADVFTLLPDVILVPGDGEVSLAVEADGIQARFSCRADGEAWQPLGEELAIDFLSGGFTGNFIGIGAHDMYRTGGSHADFAEFRYEGRA
ncbi:glycoside hydrolase family 43 protein [Paenibacillus methanolicus]|uniref:Xylan 1,4-beta-xylosidase n=1 Tax=Paenibacillus methanolicus TaxID=582686 RepID=A0A5S5CGJ8_9BACL|nr:glycoside hydrolase family 43 protein [Paenibacillus methanolicus]TYP78239.1 xylan 1,4-beta-xylosidase [Paenibacillus methanolicus]